MSNRVARTGDWFSFAVLVVFSITVVAIVFIVFTATGGFDPEHTCPNYGEVPALIDGGYECIPWEVQP